ncbi:unnamed protein product [Darwinula stevensoni]|uniref:E3 ubiquitin-protein ligase MARCH8 n=1 Tax=Darwinula stevensoni TaxID=69355 RepID=A0A7R9AFV9_9CRUS|nr:unnamed protein product [Darwinula stevensoni]CAG0903408.1 unnamed protein product [Darwinula stevensoni]
MGNQEDVSVGLDAEKCSITTKEDAKQHEGSLAGAGRAFSTSSNVSTHDICRICHCEADYEAPLIAPCYCSGSLQYVHQECLQRWIKSSDIKACELCRFGFVMHTKTKPFSKWEKLDLPTIERRKIFCSVMFHIVAITCVVWSLYILIDRTAEEVQSGILLWPFWTKLIVVAIGFSGGLVFMYIQCKMYFRLCRRWRAYNRVIYVQNVPSSKVVNDTRQPSFGCVVSWQASCAHQSESGNGKCDHDKTIAHQETTVVEVTVPAFDGSGLDEIHEEGDVSSPLLAHEECKQGAHNGEPSSENRASNGSDSSEV